MISINQVLMDESTIGLSKPFADVLLVSAEVKEFIVSSFNDANKDKFKFGDEMAMEDALCLHIDKCAAEMQEMAKTYKINVIVKRFL